MRSFAKQDLLDIIPADVGPRKKTFRGSAVFCRRSPGAQRYRPTGHWIAVLLAPSPGLEVQFASEPVRKYDASAGMLAICPAGAEWTAKWPAGMENVIVAISAESMREIASHEFDGAECELRPTYLTYDRTAFQLAKLIRDELSNIPSPSHLYLNGLLTTLGVHVLRTYSSVSKLERGERGALSKATADRLRDYLHEHFAKKLTIAELAAVCGLSPAHFARAFTRTFGVPPYQYLLDLRLDFAERLLVSGKVAPAEVAFLSGFSSQSHLTSVMKARRGKTLRQFR